MVYPQAIDSPEQNRLLAALPPEDLAWLKPKLEPVQFALRDVIHAANARIDAIYFPQVGWASMIALLDDGRSAEVGLAGREGIIGLPLLFGSDRSLVESIVQSPGTMSRLSAEAFAESLDHSAALRALLLRYALAFQQQVTQTAACNGHRALDQRMARWLLMAHDRTIGDEFPMTHEFLAMMLCVHRPGVTITARLFQRAGLIRYGNGKMTVKDRLGLQAASCECYATVSREHERLLGPV